MNYKELYCELFRRERSTLRRVGRTQKREADVRRWLTARDESGYMPIHVAAQFDSISIFHKLELLEYYDLEELRLNVTERDKEDIRNMKLLSNRTKEGQFCSICNISLFFSLRLRIHLIPQ